ncbi:MAG: histidine kinase [Vicinamibacterales bacterium]
MLAATALFAVWLDPAEPAAYSDETYTLYWVYLLYSGLLGAWTFAADTGERFRMFVHVADIVAFSVFQYLTLGPSSPFFVYFIFSMFCGAIRWGWRGTLFTGAAVMAAYLGISFAINERIVPGFEANRFIVRLAYLVVATGMLVYLGRYEARLRREIERLARWPTPSGGTAEASVVRILEYGAELVQARCVVLFWEVIGDGRVCEARWADGVGRVSPPAPHLPIVGPAHLEAQTFICTGSARAPEFHLYGDAAGHLVRGTGAPLQPEILERLQGDGIASAPFATDALRGRVIFSDFGTPATEALALTRLVAREIASSLDQLHSAGQRQELAAREERIRVARDLHDGVLQGLTGVRLELRALANVVARTSDQEAREQFVTLERALAMEQRELRYFISGLEPGADQRIGRSSPLAVRLDGIGERLALEWKTPVTLRVAHRLDALPAAIEAAVPLMVHEAAVNALKHAQASRVAVDVGGGDGQLTIAVTDDGRGFPFKGRYNHDTLAELPTVPRTLFDRVSALGGRLSIESSERGSRIEMLLSY